MKTLMYMRSPRAKYSGSWDGSAVGPASALLSSGLRPSGHADRLSAITAQSPKPVTFALVETKPVAPTAKFEITLGSGEVLRIPADVESLRMVFEALRAAR
ncbi:MAG TPA: hypothetical protein VG168_15705 [Bryobacteraceae bacterium]|nr:hypothetical protein [Bryobacteraceae bacterium]